MLCNILQLDQTASSRQPLTARTLCSQDESEGLLPDDQGPATAILVPGRPRPSQRASAYETLVGLLGGEERAEVYEQDVPLRMARYLREVDRIGAELDAADLDEAAAILGKRPSDPESAEAALERVVLEAGPDRDVELLTFFLRRSRRAECLLAHSLRRLQRSTLQPLA